MQLRLKSYASRKQLAVTQAEIEGAMELEWDRRLITVLGTANNRLYEFRLQTANKTYETSKVLLCRYPLTSSQVCAFSSAPIMCSLFEVSSYQQQSADTLLSHCKDTRAYADWPFLFYIVTSIACCASLIFADTFCRIPYWR